MNDFEDGELEPRRRKRRGAKAGFGAAKSRFEPKEPGSLDLDGAREAALAILTRTSKSTEELESALIKKGATAEVAAAVVKRFVEVDLVDDARLAKGIVNTRVALKRESASAIRRELEKRGLSRHAEAALAELNRDAELQNAIELAVARFRRVADLDRETRMRRLSGFLARKGYSGDVVGRAIREAEAQAKIEA